MVGTGCVWVGAGCVRVGIRRGRRRWRHGGSVGAGGRPGKDLDRFEHAVGQLPLLGLLDPSATVADLGCGTGHLAQSLAPFVAKVIAVDGSAAMLRAARARLADLANVDIRRGDLEELPLEDGAVDLAFLVLVLPYLAAPGAAIAEAARVLRPGGRLLLTDLVPHERAEYRQTLGHLWQGVSEAQLAEWCAGAGLRLMTYHPVPLDAGAKGTMLFTAVAIRS